MTPYEIFRAWEMDDNSGFMHAVFFERGDGDPQDRLTVTDEFIIDEKGVGGVHYHEVYPEPVACLKKDSAITISMSLNETSYAGFKISDRPGIGNLLTGPDMLGKQFVVKRGDVAWSLLEEDLPYAFWEIFSGRVSKVLRGVGEWLIETGPIKWNMDRVIASPEKPIIAGQAFNFGAVLVDSGSDEYRVASNYLEVAANNFFELRDNGSPFNPPSHGAPGYAHIKEDVALNEDVTAQERGKFGLTGGSPIGKITGSYKSDPDNPYPTPLSRVIRESIAEYLNDDYRGVTDEIDLSAVLTGVVLAGSPFIYPDKSKIYFSANGVNGLGLYQFSITDEEVGGIVYDAVYTTNAAITGTIFHQFRGASNNLYCRYSYATIKKFTLLSAPNIDSISLDSEKDLGGNVLGLIVEENETDAYIVREDGVMEYWQMGIVGDASTLALVDDAHFQLGTYDRFPREISISPNGRFLIYKGVVTDTVYQFYLSIPGSLQDILYINRSFFTGPFNHGVENILNVSMTSVGTFLFMFENGSVGESVLDVGKLPKTSFRVNTYESYYQQLSGGVHYDSETLVGKLLKDLVGSLNSSMSIGPHGALVATRLRDPDYALPAYEPVVYLKASDFWGKPGEAIEHVDTVLPLNKVTVTYGINNSPQNETELGGSVEDDDLRALYATSNKSAASDNDLPGYDDKVINTHIGVFHGAHAQSVADDEANLRSVPRQYYRLYVKLKAISILNELMVGGIIVSDDQWPHEDIPVGAQLQVVDHDIDYSGHRRVITAFL